VLEKAGTPELGLNEKDRPPGDEDALSETVTAEPLTYTVRVLLAPRHNDKAGGSKDIEKLRATKFAVWVMESLIVTEAGFADPLYEPDPEPVQLSKA